MLNDDITDFKSEVIKLKKQTSTIRKNSYRKSPLDKFHFEIRSLFENGATRAEIQRWLRTKRLKVHHSTLTRYMRLKNIME